MRLSSIDLNLLVALDAILRTKSVGKAAREVGLSKPAMSHALARLRKQLRDEVLVRSGRTWVPTDRAAALAARVHALVEEARAVLGTEPSFDPGSSAREFRIHATDHAITTLGIPLAERLSREAPDVRLRFLPILPDDAPPLRAGAVDVALGVFPDIPLDFRTQSLFRDRFVCVVRSDHPQVRSRLTLESFLELPHVLVAPRGVAGGTVDDALAARRAQRRIVAFLPYFLAALDMVARTDCVVTISKRLADMHAARFSLRVLPPPIPLAPYTIVQVWHPRVDGHPAHAWLRRLIAEVARAGEFRGTKLGVSVR